MWLVAPIALLIVGALSLAVYHYAYELFAHAADRHEPPKPVNVSDVVKTTVTVLTLIGAVLAGIYAYRKQLLAEGDARRADASQLADRYTTAAEQLGHERAAVRLAGVYALARLADDWIDQRQVCIDVLCAYLRMPYEPHPAEATHKEGEREVRLTIIRTIRDHLRHPDTPTSWTENFLDFTGATFDGGDFTDSHFHGRADFRRAIFPSGIIDFRRAVFSGTVIFRTTKFSGSTVDFTHAEFSGGTVDFTGATFSGGTVSFRDVLLRSGEINFEGAEQTGGTVDFTHARSDGTQINWGPFPHPPEP
ncbi:pentapeptide repeat-containing protein [Streptomyces longisporoflavus]|uniref:Pentapeptide repeat-containing protein n=1 Tax=Streptomyces longisporoflavus TaxID=28044 RepID=A0ABW7R5F3_9ACTN